MPNWCSNQIVVNGNKKSIDEIKSILNTIKDKDNSNVFLSLLNVTNTDDDWYENNIRNFGTKWDVSYNDCNFVFDNETITLTPETAWAPPEAFCQSLSTKYNVEVNIIYSEPGCDFAGKSTFHPSEDAERESYGYQEGLYFLDRDNFWENIICDIEYNIDEGINVDEFIENFTFMTDEDIEKLKSLYNETKESI